MLELLQIIVTVFILWASNSEAQQLTVVYSNASFPEGQHTIWYDGDDSVYIFGGLNDGQSGTNYIHKYSLEADTIERVGSLPGVAWYGCAEADYSGNMFYFGGQNLSSDPNVDHHNEVYKFDPVANTSERVTVENIDYRLTPIPIIFKRNSSVNRVTMLRPIESSYFLEFDMESFEYNYLDVATTFPYWYWAFVQFNETKGYIFPSWMPFGYYGYHVWEINLQTLETTPLTDLPNSRTSLPVAVTDGEHIFVISTFFDENQPDINYQGILQFHPASGLSTFLPVDNWPTNGGWFIDAPRSVYIPKLNRIYGFGGPKRSGKVERIQVDKTIWYIDLSPLSATGETPSATTPTTTPTLNPDFCNGQPNGFYPHPTNCSVFISCWDGADWQLTCPDGTFYDTTSQTCRPSDEVECPIYLETPVN